MMGFFLRDSSRSSRLIDLFYLVVILLACLKVTYGITNLLEIVFADESAYLCHGTEFKLSFFLGDGFLYLLWYKFLSFFISNPVYLYCYNYVILMWLNAVLMYILFRKMGRSPFFSALFSIVFLISSVNVFTWPFITRFALSIILLIFILLLSVKENKTKFWVALAGLVVLSYVRPEFVLSLVLFSIVSLVLLGRRYLKAPEKFYGPLFIVTLAICLFVTVVKNPAAGNRSMIAFGQHYVNNLRQWETNDGKPWKGKDWRQALREKFNTDRSLSAAFLNNPGEIAKHTWTNVKKMPYKTLYAHYPFTLGGYPGWVILLLKVLIVVLYLAAILNFFADRRGSFQKNKGNIFQIFNFDDRIFYFLAFVLLVPSALSMAVIFPRDHYILIFVGILLLLLVKNLPVFEFPASKGGPETAEDNGTGNEGEYKIRPYMGFRDVLGRVIGPAAVLILLFFIPWRASGTHGLLPGPFTNICSNLKRVQIMKSVPVSTEVRFLGTQSQEWLSHWPFKRYARAGSQFTYHFFQLETSTFNATEWINEKEINMILVDRKMLKDKQLRADPLFNALVENPAAKGWTKVDIPLCAEYLLVKNDILCAVEGGRE
jgi:hypothetical protein